MRSCRRTGGTQQIERSRLQTVQLPAPAQAQPRAGRKPGSAAADRNRWSGSAPSLVLAVLAGFALWSQRSPAPEPAALSRRATEPGSPPPAAGRERGDRLRPGRRHHAAAPLPPAPVAAPPRSNQVDSAAKATAPGSRSSPRDQRNARRRRPNAAAPTSAPAPVVKPEPTPAPPPVTAAPPPAEPAPAPIAPVTASHFTARTRRRRRRSRGSATGAGRGESRGRDPERPRAIPRARSSRATSAPSSESGPRSSGRQEDAFPNRVRARARHRGRSRGRRHPSGGQRGDGDLPPQLLRHHRRRTNPEDGDHDDHDAGAARRRVEHRNDSSRGRPDDPAPASPCLVDCRYRPHRRRADNSSSRRARRWPSCCRTSTVRTASSSTAKRCCPTDRRTRHISTARFNRSSAGSTSRSFGNSARCPFRRRLRASPTPSTIQPARSSDRRRASGRFSPTAPRRSAAAGSRSATACSSFRSRRSTG